MLRWNLQGHEYRFAELRRLRHCVPGKFHVQRRNVCLQLGIQVMRQPVRCDLGLLHEWLAKYLSERTNVLQRNLSAVLRQQYKHLSGSARLQGRDLRKQHMRHSQSNERTAWKQLLHTMLQRSVLCQRAGLR
jgi:hypothetical protein